MSARNVFHQKNDTGSCQCAECSRTFGGLKGFDAHRADVTSSPYDWRCATDEELAAKGYHLNAKGWWVGEYTGPARAVA